MNLDLDYIRSFRNGQTDAEIIGAAKQPGDEWFIDYHDTYAWYRAIGRAKNPSRILELGVRYGYALVAMAKGAMDNSMFVHGIPISIPVLTGIDSEFDGIASNEIARSNINWICPCYGIDCPHRIIKIDTLVLDPLSIADRAPFDIIHVDGNHSMVGIERELWIADTLIAADGWILVDDIDTPHVLNAALQFAVKQELNCVHIPTFHGMVVIPMGDN